MSFLNGMGISVFLYVMACGLSMIFDLEFTKNNAQFAIGLLLMFVGIIAIVLLVNKFMEKK